MFSFFFSSFAVPLRLCANQQIEGLKIEIWGSRKGAKYRKAHREKLTKKSSQRKAHKEKLTKKSSQRKARKEKLAKNQILLVLSGATGAAL